MSREQNEDILTQKDENEKNSGETVLIGSQSVDIPKIIGDLEIISIIAKGGMGTVYKAKHKKLGTERAVKILSPEYSSNEDFIKRFIREAQIAAILQHPNIVTIHNIGSEKNIHYIEMEYIDGVNLNEIKDSQGKIPLPIALFIITQVCKALDNAHTKKITYNNESHHGIIHRDIKPSNIMVTNAGDVKLMDFGIARAIEMRDVTIAGTLIGTIPYMSREQLDGEQVDFLTDIYSLGVVLYELLTREKPFGTTPITEVMRKVTSGKYRSPRELDPQIPKDVEQIIKKAMALYPKDRYQDVMEMYKDIQNYLTNFKFDTYEEEIKKYLKCKDRYKFECKKPPKEKKLLNLFWVYPIIILIVGTIVVGYFSLLQKSSKIWVTSNLPGIKVYIDGKLINQTDGQSILINKVSRGIHEIDVYLTSTEEKQSCKIVVDEFQELVEFNFSPK